MAIENSDDKALPVKDIYVWILNNFPYYRNAPTGWKNSVRHNLSLNKCFKKVDKSPVSIVSADTDTYFYPCKLRRTPTCLKKFVTEFG